MSIEEQIRQAALTYGVPPELAVAVAQRESSLNPYAVGDEGQAVGLFQIHPAAAADVGLDPNWRYNLEDNIYGGVNYLRQMFDRFGSWDLALAAYNAGPGNVRAGGGYADAILASLGLSPGGGQPSTSYEDGGSTEEPWTPASGVSGGVVLGAVVLGLVGLAVLSD